MIQKHRFNRIISDNVYHKMGKDIEKKGCYNNVFHMLSAFPDKFREGDWRVAYGFMQVSPDSNVIVRHCFVLNRDGEVIDPTLSLLINEKIDKDEDVEYISFFRFKGVSRYIKMLQSNDNYTDLFIPLADKESEARIWAENNGYVVLG